MRIVHALTGLAALAAASAARPAEAAQAREPWDRSGGWEIHVFDRGACAALRQFPSLTRLSLLVTDRGHSELNVSNPQWSPIGPGTYRLRLVVEGRPRSVLPVRQGQVYNSGQTIWVGPDFPAQLAAASALEIDRPDGSPADRLELAGAASAVDRLGPCLAESARAASAIASRRPMPGPPPPPRGGGKTKRARAQASLAALFSSDDYPAAAVRAREEGAVGFRLQVDRTGRVSGCTVIASSGSASLDSTTCSLLVRRARFMPARDSKGRPVEDSVSGRIVWRFPAPPPPPTSPPPPSP